MTECAEFLAKQDFLSSSFTLVSPREFFDDIFPDDELERSGHPDDQKPNIIIAHQVRDESTNKVWVRNQLVFAGKDGIEVADKSSFAVFGMCTFSGRQRTAVNAYKCYGFAIDLDGVGLSELDTLLMGFNVGKLPIPQYLVNSGHGLHLYYIFEQAVPLYPHIRSYMQRMKYGLIKLLWTNETSTITSTPDKDNRQYQGIYQCMRVPGSCSKLGKGEEQYKYLVTAYRYNSQPGFRTSLSELNRFLRDDGLGAYCCPDSTDYSSWDYEGVTLDEARELWPEWYEKRIVQKQPPSQWVCHRGLYDWWLKKICDRENGARDGTRYYCIGSLFVYGVKCDIPYAEIMNDAMGLVEEFNRRTIKPSNEFTKEDVLAASKFYTATSARKTISWIELKTKIHIPRRPKPKLTAEQNRKMILPRAMQQLKDPEGKWRKGNGRKPKKDAVLQWRRENPQGRKIDCIRATGISKATVYKWWDSYENS